MDKPYIQAWLLGEIADSLDSAMSWEERRLAVRACYLRMLRVLVTHAAQGVELDALDTLDVALRDDAHYARAVGAFKRAEESVSDASCGCR
jgi:hypothetical protein